MNLIFSTSTHLTKLNEYYLNVGYQNSDRNLDVSRLFIENGMSEEAFDTYFQLKPKDSDRVPPLVTKELPVLIDGSEIDQKSYGEYYLTKLSPTDPRCAVLVCLTSCCQHLDCEGVDCAKNGIESEEAGFYALCKRGKKYLLPKTRLSLNAGPGAVHAVHWYSTQWNLGYTIEIRINIRL